MVVSSNRSPSPLSSRPNPPHSRNLESKSTVRRSFNSNTFHRPSILTNPKSFNPVTPANSPAGFGRRNSMGKEGMGQLQSCEEKENDKDQILKPVKLRSPTNGPKNFMSPTISAVSKFTPSPRKKPLVERNDPLRTSISLSDGKAIFFSAISSENTEDSVPKSELLAEQKVEGCLESTVTRLDQNEAVQSVLECPPASKTMKRVTFAELPLDSKKGGGLPSENVINDSDSLDVKSNAQNQTSCFSVSPVIASLDADPSVPPYDPKTNYLSPRPQFLHYKPNPRIEVLLQNKEKGLDSEVKKLEDSFILDSLSDTFSDTDGPEESNSDDSNKYFEDSSVETEEPEMKEQEEGFSDKLDISTPELPEKMAGGKGSFFTSLKFASLLLVFLISVISISVTNCPIMNSAVPKTLNLEELHLPLGIADATKANFDAFTERFKQLSFDSVSHLSMLVNPQEAGHDNLSPLQFINLTDLQKDVLVGGHIHASGSPLPIVGGGSPRWRNIVGGKESEKLTGDFEKEDLEFQENGESLPFEEETQVGSLSADIFEAELDGEIDLETQELTPALVPEVKEPQSLEEPKINAGASDNDTNETAQDGEMLLGNQELKSIPVPIHQMHLVPGMKEPQSSEEPKINAGASDGDTNETAQDGEMHLGNQELKPTPASVSQMNEPENLETVWGQEEEVSNEETEVKNIINVEDYMNSVTGTREAESLEEKALEIQPEPFGTTKLEEAIDLDSGAKVEYSTVVDMNTTPLNVEDRHSEIVKSPIGALQNLLPAYFTTGVTSVILALISAAAYVYLNLNRGTTSKPNPAAHTVQFLSKKINPASSVLEQIHQQQPPSYQEWPTEVNVMGGDSCTSEMSSFQSYSSSHNRLRSANEAQSQERKAKKHSKRESLASSTEFSTGSPSYGSFTTYEKIPSKNVASGDDEVIMTPVRRSSRIRNLVTSP